MGGLFTDVSGYADNLKLLTPSVKTLTILATNLWSHVCLSVIVACESVYQGQLYVTIVQHGLKLLLLMTNSLKQSHTLDVFLNQLCVLFAFGIGVYSSEVLTKLW